MSKYILYRYQFSPIQSNVQSLFPVDVDKMSDEDLMQNKQTLFASLFGENAEIRRVISFIIIRCFSAKVAFLSSIFPGPSVIRRWICCRI